VIELCRRILKRVNPEENLWIESLIRLPLSPIRLPLRAKKNGWVNLDEVDMKRPVVVVVEGVEKLRVAVDGGDKRRWTQECNPMMQ
jgi:hypothetical protein